MSPKLVKSTTNIQLNSIAMQTQSKLRFNKVALPPSFICITIEIKIAFGYRVNITVRCHLIGIQVMI